MLNPYAGIIRTGSTGHSQTPELGCRPVSGCAYNRFQFMCPASCKRYLFSVIVALCKDVTVFMRCFIHFNKRILYEKNMDSGIHCDVFN